MKRRAVYFLLCVCFCFSLLSQSCFAVEYDPYTGEELIYDESEGTYYSMRKPLEFEPFMLYSLSSPEISDFSLTSLPWLEMPTYVQEILKAEPIGLTNDSSYSGEYKLPFVSLVVSNTTIRIHAGYNLCVGARFYDQTDVDTLIPDRFSLICLKQHEKIYANAVCYTAVYRLSDYSLKTAWSSVDPVAVGDNVVWYYNYPFNEIPNDFYFYGSSGMLANRSTQKTFCYDDGGFPYYMTVNNSISGFASGRITYLPDLWQGYIGTFTPPSAEALQQSTSKGIWDTLKALPSSIANAIKGFFTELGDRISSFFTSLGDRISLFFDNLADKIKGFFLPAEGFFDTYVEDFQNYFKDRFGLLYEIPEYVVTIIDMFLKFSPKESGYSIDFPEVVMPVLDDGEWHDEVLIEETTITFEFLEEGAFATLYTMYRSVVWMIFIFALVNLIIRKSEKVFGGSGG